MSPFLDRRKMKHYALLTKLAGIKPEPNGRTEDHMVLCMVALGMSPTNFAAFDQLIDKLIPMSLDSETEPSGYKRKGFGIKHSNGDFLYLSHVDYDGDKCTSK